MNYEENKTQWKVGDLVLHDADAKRPEMLMKVIGYAKDGRCKTRYAEPNQMNQDAIRIKMRLKPEVWENAIRVLHDPARFGVTVVQPNDPSSPTAARPRLTKGNKMNELQESQPKPEAGLPLGAAHGSAFGAGQRVLARLPSTACTESQTEEGTIVGMQRDGRWLVRVEKTGWKPITHDYSESNLTAMPNDPSSATRPTKTHEHD